MSHVIFAIIKNEESLLCKINSSLLRVFLGRKNVVVVYHTITPRDFTAVHSTPAAVSHGMNYPRGLYNLPGDAERVTKKIRGRTRANRKVSVVVTQPFSQLARTKMRFFLLRKRHKDSKYRIDSIREQRTMCTLFPR